MVTFVIAIIETIRSEKCKIHNFLKKFVRNRKLGVYYLFLFRLRAKIGQEDLFTFAKVSYKGDFLKVYNKQTAKKIFFTFDKVSLSKDYSVKSFASERWLVYNINTPCFHLKTLRYS